MLPGFRFLFAAIMLSMSLLVFGLGAAALLRAAHESFASNSPWRATPDVPFAQRPESALPMLAALRVEPQIEQTDDATRVAAAPAATAPLPAEPVVGVQSAVVKPAETPAVDAATPENTPIDTLSAQSAPAPEAMPSAARSAGVTVVTAETKTATTPETPASNDTPAVTKPEPATTAASTPSTGPAPADPVAAPATDSAITKIATLGGPPVDIVADTPVKNRAGARSDQAKDDPSAVKKRVQARRTAHRRRLAARAQLAAQQLQQTNPFAQPAVPATTLRQRRQGAITP